MAKLRNLFPLLCALYAASAGAQGALDLYTISQTDLRGSARFMSMAGAFGALGADLSTLNQNPGGIGVYRSSEVGMTMGGVKKNGFGFPTVAQKTVINLGFEYKRRKAYPASLVTENYFNITLGINFKEFAFWKEKIR